MVSIPVLAEETPLKVISILRAREKSDLEHLKALDL